jgi:5-methylcytosine-specific restriction endonuclease McrA
LCGIDCEREGQIRDETINLWRWLAHREAERLEELGQLPAPPNGYPESVFFWAHRWVNEDITAKGWKDYGHTWEADHVVPVVEGGGQCGLDNFRTLCLSCHRKETAKLLRRRAEQRRIVPGQLAFAQ